jgi:hypothetical protein
MKEEMTMKRFVPAAVLVLVLAGAAPALAADMPPRKAGLWELRMNGAALAVQQCIDAATDQMMMSGAGPLAQTACSKRDVQRSGNTMTIDSACTYKDKAATSHAVITGSLDSAYEMTVRTEADGLPGGKMTMTIAAKWLGPCAADQKPGDMIMGGIKLNILEMQKQAPSQGVPLPR